MTPNDHKSALPVNRFRLGSSLARQSGVKAPTGKTQADKAQIDIAQTAPDAQGNSLRFERRRADRHPVAGRVTSLQYSGPVGPDQHRKIASLQMVNISDTGACVLTQDPVELNAAMTIFFPPHGPDRGFDAVGHVVRCSKRDDNHHELGIRFDFKPAA